MSDSLGNTFLVKEYLPGFAEYSRRKELISAMIPSKETAGVPSPNGVPHTKYLASNMLIDSIVLVRQLEDKDGLAGELEEKLLKLSQSLAYHLDDMRSNVTMAEYEALYKQAGYQIRHLKYTDAI